MRIFVGITDMRKKRDSADSECPPDCGSTEGAEQSEICAICHTTSGSGYSTPKHSTVTVCITCGVSGLS